MVKLEVMRKEIFREIEEEKDESVLEKMPANNKKTEKTLDRNN
jgi:sRNA-binding carbon storage regulator CsrA